MGGFSKPKEVTDTEQVRCINIDQLK